MDRTTAMDNIKAMEDNFEFLQPVLIKNKLDRREEREKEPENSLYQYRTKKVWKPNPFKKFKPVEGFFLGWRTVNNGYRRFRSDHIEYNPTEYYKVALVVTDRHTNPFYTNNLEPK